MTIEILHSSGAWGQDKNGEHGFVIDFQIVDRMKSGGECSDDPGVGSSQRRATQIREIDMSQNVTRRDFLKNASAASVAGTAAALGTPATGAESRKTDTGANSGAAEFVHEEPRETPVAGTFDVCVVGGSCTGVFAAVAAARLGARVCVIENNGFFGGVATASLVNVWHSTFDTTHRRRIIAGLTLEMIERLKKRDACVERISDSVGYTLTTEELKIELDKLVVESGVRPFLHTLFVAPVVRDGRLEAVIIEDKTGRRAIKASYFVDATGDGDVAARMGLHTYQNDNIQPPTMCAIVRGLKAIQEKHPDFQFQKVIYDKQYDNALKKGFAWTAAVPGSVDDTMIAATRVFGADCSDADDLTRASIEGRRQVRAICDILNEHFIDDKTVPLVELPTKIGIRDTRHVRCLHQVTEMEVLRGKRFPDAIANGCYRVDVHLANEDGLIFRYLDGREQFVSADGTRKVGRWRDPMEVDPTFYQVPYRSLVPRGSRNLLIAGRMIDAEPGAFGGIRVMVNCNQMGQAAGTASYLALDSQKDVADVDTDKLRATLTSQGALII